MSETIDPIVTADTYRALVARRGRLRRPSRPTGGHPVHHASARHRDGRRDPVRPEPGEWSVLESIGHITDVDLVATRERWILAEDVPDVVAMDQDLWVDRLDHNADDTDILLAMFEAIRQANLDLWSRRSERDRARVGHHRQRGEAHRTLDAVRRSGGR